MTLLKAIEEQKDILFGKFSDKLSKVNKDEAWQGVAELARQLSVMKSHQSVEYFRNTIWQNWRRKAIVRFQSQCTHIGESSNRFCASK